LKANKLNATVAALQLVLGLAITGSAFAGPIAGSTVVPLIVAGGPPDSPSARVDPNLPTSPYSGVVSINIRYPDPTNPSVQLSFICSGTLVSQRDVVSAGHCVDTDGNGHVITNLNTLNAQGKITDVRVVFNSQPNPGDPGRAIIAADHVYMNPNYQGFGNCPAAVPPGNFCVNDDVSVIHMNADAPATAKIYGVYGGAITTGQSDTLVGYGLSGTGLTGYTVNPDFRVKRSGQNIMDLFDTDDEQNFSNSSPQEVWYSDFDGYDSQGVLQDTFCTLFGVCTPILANSVETNLGGGDSGGPSFLTYSNGQLLLMGNNTFGGTFDGQVSGTFGTYFGGILLNSYIPWLERVTGNAIQLVPEPSTYALLLLALVLMGTAGRRRQRN
jgi:PEP-CTERM motif/Trypsin